MARDLTRRDLIASGAGAAGLALLGQAGCASDDGQAKPAPLVRKPAPAGAMNVLVVVMDSLRVDHVYGSHARTEAIDSLVGDGLRFTRAYPEGMPTIPARRSIMEGHRVYPFRGWHPFKGLTAQPGWEPIGHDRPVWTDYLQERGWTTGYVTDNPHIVSSAHDDFRKRFDRPELIYGQVPEARKGAHDVSKAELYKYLPPSIRGTRAEPRMLEYLRSNPRDRPEEEFLAATRLQAGHGLAPVGAHAAAVRAGGRLLRRPRALGRPTEPDRHLRQADHARGGADPALPDARRAARDPSASRVVSCGGWPISTPPR